VINIAVLSHGSAVFTGDLCVFLCGSHKPRHCYLLRAKGNRTTHTGAPGSKPITTVLRKLQARGLPGPGKDLVACNMVTENLPQSLVRNGSLTIRSNIPSHTDE
jgi:hypothetical protein